MLALLTNDDGIHAPGLLSLEAAVAQLGWQSIIVAPAAEQSQCGHRVTTHLPLKVEQHAPDRHAVDGTPADCVRIGLFALGLKPDVVISGINAGANMGQDIFISGTVAAAREAAYHGIRSVAFSHYMIRSLPIDWQRTSAWVAALLLELDIEQHQPKSFWNINLPHLPNGSDALPARVPCTPACSPLNVAYTLDGQGYSYNASYASRPRDPGSDVEACFGGNVSVSLLHV